MKRPLAAIAVLLMIAMPLGGCNLAGPNRKFDAELEHYKAVSKTVEYADILTPPSPQAFVPQPRTILKNAVPQVWRDMTVEEAIYIALANSSVLRDLGGTVLRYPESMRTILHPAIVGTDPRFGMEAALAEFDAELATSVVAEKNDRQVNNLFVFANNGILEQDLVNFRSQISKRSAAGTQLILRGASTYDANTNRFNIFPSTWDSLVEAEFRQPLLQGAGARFNRLAGPNAVPGFYNGVLIARTNTDISTVEFEAAVRDLISNVENAYWDLYFAYRDLDAKIQARNAALEVWKSIAVMRMAQQAGGRPEREAQAREQYYRYEEEVQNALAGRLLDATTNNNGSSGGSFRGAGGVLVAERRLRLAMGIPVNGEEMIRPIDEPTLARVEFDWGTASGDALVRRPELQRQRLLVKRREMEFVASRNFLLPRFDLLGRYRWRGMGKGLIGDIDPSIPVPNPSFAQGSLDNLASGDFQEWQLGGEITFPIGFRRAYAGVRNAQLLLAREKALLEEQERQIMHDLSNAVADLDRAYQVMRSSYNRRLAAQQNVELTRAAMAERPDVNPEQLLEAHRRLTEADIQYHRALVEHMLAIKNVHFEKGTLLEYGRVQLAERAGNALPPAVPTPATPATGSANPPGPASPAGLDASPSTDALPTLPAGPADVGPARPAGPSDAATPPAMPASPPSVLVPPQASVQPVGRGSPDPALGVAGGASAGGFHGASWEPASDTHGWPWGPGDQAHPHGAAWGPAQHSAPSGDNSSAEQHDSSTGPPSPPAGTGVQRQAQTDTSGLQAPLGSRSPIFEWTADPSRQNREGKVGSPQPPGSRVEIAVYGKELGDHRVQQPDIAPAGFTGTTADSVVGAPAAGHGWLPYQTPVPFTRLPAPEPVPPAPAYTMLPPVAPESENQVHRLPPPAYHLQQAPGASPENATYRLPAP